MGGMKVSKTALTKWGLIIIAIVFVYLIIATFTSKGFQAGRYLDKITNIEEKSIIAFNATLGKDNKSINLFTNKDERFHLMIDLLHEIKSLKEIKTVSNDNEYSNSIFANIETARSHYQVMLRINPTNFNIQIVQINADSSMDKMFKYFKYYEASEKSKNLIKKIFLTSNS